jgi:hypothetical protein
MSDDDLGAAWGATQDRLPRGWTLTALRCASTSLRPEDRSEDWIAVATHDDGREREHRAGDPFAALDGLPDSIG